MGRSELVSNHKNQAVYLYAYMMEGGRMGGRTLREVVVEAEARESRNRLVDRHAEEFGRAPPPKGPRPELPF